MQLRSFLAPSAILLASLALAQNPGAPPQDAPLIGSIQGPDLYRSYCAVCHGADATGHGPMAPSLKTPPPDLTRLAARNGGLFPRDQVRRIISGEQTQASHGTREMPLWGPIFSQVTRDVDLGRVRVDNLARYLEELQRK
jgi:mono/diheme cytochrome c family protein